MATSTSFDKSSNSSVIVKRQAKLKIKTMKYIQCLKLWFQIRETLQLLFKISRRSKKHDGSLYNKEHSPQCGNSPQGEFSNKKLPAHVELIFSIDQKIKYFFPLCLPFCNFSKHMKHAVLQGCISRSTY